MTASLRNRLITAGATGLFVVPMVFDLAVHGWTRVFRYFAADCYLYLTVGRNLAERGVFTIDHVHPTNGFQPLWQLFVGLLYWVGNGLSIGEPTILVLTALSNILFIAVAIWLICRSYLLARGRLPVSLLFLPLGVYGLLAAPLPTAFGSRGTLWGFVNGMESGLSLFLYGFFVLVLVRRGFANARSALLIGVLLAALLLSRLDNIFLAIALCLVLGVRAVVRRDLASFRQALLVGAPVLVVLGCYLAINLATVGLALPVSALAKTTAPNLSKLGEIRGALSEPFPLRSWRLAQIFLPMLIAGVALAHHRRAWVSPRMTPLERMFVPSAVFVLLLGLYNFLVVPTLHQGHWYFPISILFTSLFVFHLLDLSPRFSVLESRPAAVAFVLVTLLVFLHFYYGDKLIGPQQFTNFVTEEVPRLRRHYRAVQPKTLSFDDGIVAYATGWPVMTWRGFMLDAESIEYYRRPDLSLLDLAYQRGFDRLTAVFYFNATGLEPTSPSTVIRVYLRRQLHIPPRELDRFDYSVDYLSPNRRFAMIRMHPRPGVLGN